MAVKEVKMSENLTEVAKDYNASNEWARIYFNLDSGYIFFEDGATCPKDMDKIYQGNPSVVVLFEKNNPEKGNCGCGCGCSGPATADAIVKAANERLA